ncbi:MAG: hypothetical protein LBR21_09945 [Propionibacteriaceae bacterium]|nr:hypothetical protein [Propionibacteriaceae bacterium]
MTRGPIWAALFFVLVGLCACADVLAVGTVATEAREYLQVGASTFVLKSDRAVDGRTCENLGNVTGVLGAGALRSTSQTLVFAATPSSPVPIMESTPGLGTVLGLAHKPADGLLVPRSLADSLGLTKGGNAPVLPPMPGRSAESNEVKIAGVYEYPEDGRSRDLGYLALAQVPGADVFDSCWLKLWPPDPEYASSLLRTALTSRKAQDATVRQLNSSRGLEFNPSSQYERRPTRYIWIIGLLGGFGLGTVSARTRKLELASNLHAGYPKRRLEGQMLLEGGFWVMSGTLLVSAAVVYLNRLYGLGLWGISALGGMKVPLCAALGALAGVWLATHTTREEALFSYFKER